MSNGRKVSACCGAFLYQGLTLGKKDHCSKCYKVCKEKLIPHTHTFVQSPRKNYPKPNINYIEKSSGLPYTFLFTAFTRQLAPMAVYRTIDTTLHDNVAVWVRPLEEFMRLFKKEPR